MRVSACWLRPITRSRCKNSLLKLSRALRIISTSDRAKVSKKSTTLRKQRPARNTRTWTNSSLTMRRRESLSACVRHQRSRRQRSKRRPFCSLSSSRKRTRRSSSTTSVVTTKTCACASPQCVMRLFSPRTAFLVWKPPLKRSGRRLLMLTKADSEMDARPVRLTIRSWRSSASTRRARKNSRRILVTFRSSSKPRTKR